MQLLAPAAGPVLAAYYGSDSQLIQIYPLTPSGQRLLRRSGNRQLELSPVQRLENDLLAQTTTPDAGRKALLDKAHDQARELYESACRAWNEVVHGAREPRDKPRKAPPLVGDDEEPAPAVQGAA